MARKARKLPEPPEDLAEIPEAPTHEDPLGPTDDSSSAYVLANPGPAHSPLEERPRRPRSMAWKCACGKEFPETGSASGYGRWAQHLSIRQEGCRGVGLVDTETGEILVPMKGNVMSAIRDAIQAGYMPPKEERDRLREQERLARGVSPESAPAGAAAPRNLEAIVPLERIALPAWVWALKLSTDPFLLKADGTPYGWSSEDKAEWLADMLEIAWHAVMLQDPARALGVDPDQAEQLVQAGFFQHFLARLKGMPEPELARSLRELGAANLQPSIVSGGR